VCADPYFVSYACPACPARVLCHVP
jgi:hypothetical protein